MPFGVRLAMSGHIWGVWVGGEDWHLPVIVLNILRAQDIHIYTKDCPAQNVTSVEAEKPTFYASSVLKFVTINIH